MNDFNSWQERDHQHVWHPCSQMKEYRSFQPVIIKKAKGCYLETIDGRLIIDAVSSWWCKSLGHQVPEISNAIKVQLDSFEHVMLATVSHPLIIELSEALSSLNKKLNKVFYASEGSSAVEIALKMSVHSRLRQGNAQKNQIFYLENAYHGETTGAMSVSDLGLYRDAYQTLLFDAHALRGIPYVTSREDDLFNDVERVWPGIEAQLEQKKGVLTAIIVEPIVQAAAGMLFYSPAFLKKVSLWCKDNDVHLIADEIMTGLGRTGRSLACDHAGVTPDFLCLGKGLTSGYLPLSAVLTHDEIYGLFYDDVYLNGFLHSHTFSGNALGCSAALATLKYIKTHAVYAKAAQLEYKLFSAMKEIEAETGLIHRVRAFGAIAACELIPPYHDRSHAYAVFQHALKHGAFLRPLPPVIYWVPPLIIEDHTIEELKHITRNALLSLKK